MSHCSDRIVNETHYRGYISSKPYVYLTTVTSNTHTHELRFLHYDYADDARYRRVRT